MLNDTVSVRYTIGSQYSDTDSIIFKRRRGVPLPDAIPIGNNLGEYQEDPREFMSFYCSSPKSYSCFYTDIATGQIRSTIKCKVP